MTFCFFCRQLEQNESCPGEQLCEIVFFKWLNVEWTKLFEFVVAHAVLLALLPVNLVSTLLTSVNLYFTNRQPVALPQCHKSSHHWPLTGETCVCAQLTRHRSTNFVALSCFANSHCEITCKSNDEIFYFCTSIWPLKVILWESKLQYRNSQKGRSCLLTNSTLCTWYWSSKSTTNQETCSFLVAEQNSLFEFMLPSTAFSAGNLALVELMYAGLFKAKLSPEREHNLSSHRATTYLASIWPFDCFPNSFVQISNFSAIYCQCLMSNTTTSTPQKLADNH